jgi:glyoxylate carboligase
MIEIAIQRVHRYGLARLTISDLQLGAVNSENHLISVEYQTNAGFYPEVNIKTNISMFRVVVPLVV